MQGSASGQSHLDAAAMHSAMDVRRGRCFWGTSESVHPFFTPNPDEPEPRGLV